MFMYKIKLCVCVCGNARLSQEHIAPFVLQWFYLLGGILEQNNDIMYHQMSGYSSNLRECPKHKEPGHDQHRIIHIFDDDQIFDWRVWKRTAHRTSIGMFKAHTPMTRS